jgi:hypothetical protein
MWCLERADENHAFGAAALKDQVNGCHPSPPSSAPQSIRQPFVVAMRYGQPQGVRLSAQARTRNDASPAAVLPTERTRTPFVHTSTR